MRKIASTTELQHELRRILAYAQSDRPSRATTAKRLSALSERVAGRKWTTVGDWDVTSETSSTGGGDPVDLHTYTLKKPGTTIRVTETVGGYIVTKNNRVALKDARVPAVDKYLAKECTDSPREAAESFTLERLHDELRQAQMRTAAGKYLALGKAIIEGLKGHSGLKVKSFRANKAVLTTSLNAQLDRVEITGLDTAQAQYKFYLKNGDSGALWDGYRRPPKFYENAVELRLDRFPNPTDNPTKFAQDVESLALDIVAIAKRVGLVVDKHTQKKIPIDEWQASQKQQEEDAKRQAELAKRREEEAEARERQRKEDAAEAEARGDREAWSVVQMYDGYASHVSVFDNKADAQRRAEDDGQVYVVEGTQMWNEPLGQVEEHDRTAKYRFYSGR